MFSHRDCHECSWSNILFIFTAGEEALGTLLPSGNENLPNSRRLSFDSLLRKGRTIVPITSIHVCKYSVFLILSLRADDILDHTRPPSRVID